MLGKSESTAKARTFQGVYQIPHVVGGLSSLAAGGKVSALTWGIIQPIALGVSFSYLVEIHLMHT